jgi:hypothetical protein
LGLVELMEPMDENLQFVLSTKAAGVLANPIKTRRQEFVARGKFGAPGIARVCLFTILKYRENGDENAQTDSMGSINQISSSYLPSIFGTALPSIGSTNTTPSASSLSSAARQDNSQLSPFADIMSALQQLQQTNPSEYQQLTQQVATSLQTAAQTAQSNGNSTAAIQLNQLSIDFKNASQNGQVPNVQDLAHSLGSGYHHHHVHAASADSDSDSSAHSGSGGNASSSLQQTLSQFLSAMQPSGTQSDALNPMAIILNTLTNAGLSTSN